jgi:hypothetical protein
MYVGKDAPHRPRVCALSYRGSRRDETLRSSTLITKDHWARMNISLRSLAALACARLTTDGRMTGSSWARKSLIFWEYQGRRCQVVAE